MFFFFNDTATTEIYTLSLHDALPISPSRENQATNRPLDSSEVHTLSRVVLPKPAGAETRMSLRFIPSSIRSPRRGRGTSEARTDGTESLVSRTGWPCAPCRELTRVRSSAAVGPDTAVA